MTKILNWAEVDQSFFWDSLLLGNGFSIGVNPSFIYKNLYLHALNKKYFDSSVINVFKSLETSNFEEVLSKLQVAISVLYHLDLKNDLKILNGFHAKIREALNRSIADIHPDFPSCSEYLVKVSKVFEKYGQIFTTNYDITLYWAIMNNTKHFKDFFWEKRFNAENVDLRYPCSAVFYLHGALHLFSEGDSSPHKVEARNEKLLEKIYTEIKSGNLNLFISEGDYESKLLKIKNSSYLNFCYEKLGQIDNGLVIYGHSMSIVYDKHLFFQLKKSFERSPNLKLAISVYGHDEQTAEEIARNVKSLVSRDIKPIFFDAKTHPIATLQLDQFDEAV